MLDFWFKKIDVQEVTKVYSIAQGTVVTIL